MQRNFCAEKYYFTLIDIYKTWPNDDGQLFTMLDFISTQEDLVEVLARFKNFIHRNKNSHQYRYQKTSLLFGAAYWIGYTKYFQELDQKINQLLPKQTWGDYLQKICASAWQQCKISTSFIDKNPGVAFLLLQQSCAALINAYEIRDHSQISVKEIIEDANLDFEEIKSATCMEKTEGLNQGLVCEFNNQVNYLKEIKLTETFYTLNHPIYSLHNKKLVSDYIKILTPSLKFIKLKIETNDQYYLATEHLENFKIANDYSDEQLEKLFTHHKNLAKFAVASTLIGDLTPLNYGFIENEKLALIDVDVSPLKSNQLEQGLYDYYKMAYKGISEHSPKLSIKNIQEMKLLYERMLKNFPPRVHPSLDIADQLYFQLLSIYIRICDEVIKTDLNSPQIKNLEKKITENYKHDKIINVIFASKIAEKMHALPIKSFNMGHTKL